ncbi:MAG: glycoside hydrolase family 3 N-terminal domain-containing protein [bacterium]|nr:glycoside hydrolase family 3 N-terminal domain-containing protein [bacterium]
MKKSEQKLIFYKILGLILLAGFVLFFFLTNHRTILMSVDYSSDPRCQLQDAKYLNPALSVPERVDDLMSRMTVDEKIGQMVLVEKNSIRNIDDIARYNIGSLLSGGGGGPIEDTPLAWLQMIQNFQAATTKTCLRIPLLYGIDAIHGHGNVYGATIFPHSIGLGATRDTQLVRQIAKATADEMAATGIYWSYSPNLDVPQDTRWGKTYETFGSNPENVAQLGLAYLEGLQSSSSNYFNVLATAKHFIGGGAMEYGTSRNKDFKVEEGNITVSETELRQTHLMPFQRAVDSGVQSVMVGTASWNGVINPANRYLLTDILKNEFGFEGFVVSDWYAVYLLTPSKYTSLVTAINAGVDMVMTPFDYKSFSSIMLQIIENGDISNERINDAVKRILTAKFKTGLFDRSQPSSENLAIVGSAEHRAIAQEAVHKSQVLLKNNGSVLPLSKSLDKIIVAGSAADNLGRQAGGWTTEWQGIDGNYGIVGTTVLTGIKNNVDSGTVVEYDKLGNFSPNENLADVGIAVVSEKPYAEGWGDNVNPSLDASDLAAIQKLKSQSKKLIVLIVSGRPLNISPYIGKWDGVIASWLPGSEGQGVADVLFGLYPFTGKLPVKWNY